MITLPYHKIMKYDSLMLPYDKKNGTYMVILPYNINITI